jgi:drug/metabolite transporter (DMT)-like permease
MELWIPITIFAAFTQNLRSSLQKHLKGQLSTAGATFARFVYAAPLALLYLAGLAVFGEYEIPALSYKFAIFAMVGGLAQILATALLVHIFSFRNFVVGTTFSKTETVQTVFFSVIVLGEAISVSAALGIVVSLIGVVLISMSRATFNLHDIAKQCLELPALFGVASGSLFAISAVAYRAASLSLAGGDFIIRAAYTLMFLTIFQTIVMAIYMRVREPGQIRAVLTTWRVSGLVGVTGMLGSVGWVTAVTLQNAAYVRALGQIELLFTFAVSYFAFKERFSRVELSGVFLVTIGIFVLVIAR